MERTEEERKRLFGLLDELAELDQEDLKTRFNAENLKAFRMLFEELLDESFPKAVSPLKFADLTYRLRETKRTWSRKLGRAIIAAADSIEKDDLESAIDILEKFKRECPSPFYRENAQRQIEYYKKK
jgi:hypothetical protein